MRKSLLALTALTLFAGVLAACSTSPAPTPVDNSAAFVGTWTNTAADGSIAKIEIVKDGSTLHAHGYGQCGGGYCDWGVADTTLADAADGNIVTTWNFTGGDFITTTLTPTGAHSATLFMNDHYSGVDHLSNKTMSRP